MRDVLLGTVPLALAKPSLPGDATAVAGVTQVVAIRATGLRRGWVTPGPFDLTPAVIREKR